MMKLQNLITQIEQAFNEKWNGKRFDDIGDVHSDFRKIASQILPEGWEGLPWTIKHKKEYFDLMNYDMDITDDKRYKFHRAGRVNSMTIRTVLPITDDTTVEEYVTALRKQQAEILVKRAEEAVQSLREDLKKQEAELEKRKQFLQTFN